MTTPPVVETHDKGMIRFTDGALMSFEPGTSGLGNPLGLFPSNTKRGVPVGPAHYVAAAAYLEAHDLTG